MHREQPWGGGMCGWGMCSTGVPVEQLMRSSGSASAGWWAGLLMGVSEGISSVHVPLMCFTLSPNCCSPSRSLLPSHRAHSSGLQMMWERKGTLWQRHAPANQAFSLLPGREIMVHEGLSWRWAVPSWGMSDICKGPLFVLSSSTNLISVFVPIVHYNISTGLLDFHKRPLLCGWLSKSLFFAGKMVEDDLTMLIMSQTIYYLYFNGDEDSMGM